MTLQELRYLVALADEGHFARAAERCHVGQPTLSMQLKKLEEALGIVLFERGKRGVMPTRTGQAIINQARVVLAEADKIKVLARHATNPMAGPLRLGVIPTLGPYLLPHLLPVIQATYPELRLLIREDLTLRLLDQLRIGQLDLLVLALPVHGEDLSCLVLFDEPFWVALPHNHPLAEQVTVRQEDLESQCVLLLEEGHCLRDQALAICRRPASQAGEAVKATSLETLRQMVAGGVGCTLLPALAAQTDSVGLSALIRVLRFVAPEPSRTIGLAFRRQFPHQEVIQCLYTLIKAHLPASVRQVRQHECTADKLALRQEAALCQTALNGSAP